MQLIVAASNRPDVVCPADAYIVRLTASARPDDRPPPRFDAIADRARSHILETFPAWLWDWAQRSGVLRVRQFDGPVSWWWYTSLSEMSPMRSALIRELHALVIVRLLLEELPIDRVVWYGDDAELADAARRLTSQRGASFVPSITRLPARRRRWAAVARRLKAVMTHGGLCAALRLTGFGRQVPDHADVALYSRCPVLWDTHVEPWHERMFGSWPETLAHSGLNVMYVAVCTASVRELVTEARGWRRRCAVQGIVFVESMISWVDFLRAYVDVRLAISYWRWRSSVRAQPIACDGLDVSRLVWRQIDVEALNPEIAYDVVLASAVRRVLDKTTGVTALFLPFEYQPMERAVWAGAQNGRRSVVGVQTGAYTATQMGFAFPASQVRVDRADAELSPLPDALAAYGELPYRVFVDRLGPDRVCLTGPIRYPYLSHPPNGDRSRLLARHDLPANAHYVLVTTSAFPADSLPMLDASFRTAAQRDDVFLLLKFHYHLPLHDEAARLADRYGMPRFRIFETDLDELLTLAVATVCGGSSMGLEAIARGSMPLVFLRRGELLAAPMLEVPESSFFWATADELAAAFESTLCRDDEYAARRARWADALRAHLWPLDGHADQRLFEFLEARGVLSSRMRSAPAASPARIAAATPS